MKSLTLIIVCFSYSMSQRFISIFLFLSSQLVVTDNTCSYDFLVTCRHTSIHLHCICSVGATKSFNFLSYIFNILVHINMQCVCVCVRARIIIFTASICFRCPTITTNCQGRNSLAKATTFCPNGVS